MSLVRRMHLLESGEPSTGASMTAAPSTTLAEVNPTLKRLRAVVVALADVTHRFGDEHHQRMQRILSVILDEAMEEVAELEENMLQLWIVSFGRLMEWAATGNMSILPSELIPFACQVEGIDYETYMRDTATAEPEDMAPDQPEDRTLAVYDPAGIKETIGSRNG
jgi:hypothetical protein